VILHKYLLVKLLDMALLSVDNLEELMEALDLADRDLLEIDVGGVAQDLLEEVFTLLIVEQEVFSFFVCAHDLPRFVDPLQEQILVSVEVWLMHEQLPQSVDVFGPKGHFFLRVHNEKF
jgi:hypothetical protein